MINATGLDNGILITSSNVTVEGFTIRGATGEGILAEGTPNPSLVPAGSPTGSITGVPITNLSITHDIVQGNDQGTPTSSYVRMSDDGPGAGRCGEGDPHLMEASARTRL